MSGLTKAQLELRRSGIGASQIAVLAGLSKWSSPIEIYEEKIGAGRVLDDYPVLLGLELEAPIARVWAAQNSRYLAAVDTLRHPSKPFALATPDRAVYTTREARGDARKKKTDVRDAEKLLQVKSTNWRQRWLWGDEEDEGTDQMPDEYVCQAHWEGAVSGLQIVDFAVDFDKTRLHTRRVIVDLEIFEGLYELAERFMVDHVAKRIPPPPDATDRYTEYLKKTWPRETSANFDTVDDAETIQETIALFAKLKAAEKRIEKLIALARNQIVARISSAAGITGSFGKISYKATKNRTTTDWQKVADEALRIAGLVVQSMPEGDHRAALAEDVRTLIQKNTKTTGGYRQLRPTWAGALKLDTTAIELKLDALAVGLAEKEETR